MIRRSNEMREERIHGLKEGKGTWFSRATASFISIQNVGDKNLEIIALILFQ